MRAAGTAIAASSTVLLAACSLLSLDGFTGGGPAWTGGADAGDAGSEADARSDATGDSGAGSDAAGFDATSGDAGSDAAPLPPYRVVFVTSQLYTGNLGGTSGADSKCQTLAQPHFGGTFLAWVSDGNASPAARMTHQNLPYLLADQQTLVASDWSVLVSGTLAHPIDMTEEQTTVTPSSAQTCCDDAGCYPGNYAWTDTDPTGAIFDAGSCGEWTSADPAAEAGVGNAQDSNHWWTGWCYGVGCNALAALYCVQQ